MPRTKLAAIAVMAITIGAGAAATSAAAAPNPFYGVVGTYLPGQSDFNRIATAGAGTFRLQLDSRFVAPRPGARVFYTTDIIVAEAAESGVTLLPDLLGAPRYMARHGRLPISTAAQRSAWSALLTDYARRYGSNGTLWSEHPEIPKRPVTTWELWNEPNLGASVGGKPNARRYVRFLKISAAALRAGDPNAKILTGGLFPYKQQNGKTLIKYLNAMYRVPGAASAFDAIGVHPYAAQPKGVLRWVRVTRRIMRRHGDGAKPIYVSAFGWVTGGAGYRYTPLRTTFKQQATKLTRAYALLSANASRLGIASALWFTYTDIHQRHHPRQHGRKIKRDFITDRMGLFTIKLRPKPSWFAFARAAGGTP